MMSIVSVPVKKRLFTDECYKGEGHLYGATMCTYRINSLYSSKRRYMTK